MKKTLIVVFDGHVLRPESPPDLEPNTRYVVTVQKVVPSAASGKDAWDVLEEQAGAIEGPPDWASEHDHYLHGAPKRRQEDGR